MNLRLVQIIEAFAFAIRASAVSDRADIVSMRFRLPQPAAYYIASSNFATRTRAIQSISAWGPGASTNRVEFTSRMVVQCDPQAMENLIGHSSLKLSRTVASNIFIFQAPDAFTAAHEANRMASLPGVLASYPVVRKRITWHGHYGPAPSDPHFFSGVGGTVGQWYLENRDAVTGFSLGVDLNVRAAWPFARGSGITVAVADLGVELDHPDLVARTTNSPHYNFGNGSLNGRPLGTSSSWAHGTEVAGLIAATGNNGYGMSGVAPEANLASWVIYQSNSTLVTDEQLMDMYQYATNIVDVQNHSWGHFTLTLGAPTLLEQIGISNAVALGRAGRGVVMVRSAGNDRSRGANANDDGYLADPRIITVAAARSDGRVASYSEPGANVLVAGPSADTGFPGLFTTDLTGGNGVNFFGFFPPFDYLNNFVYNSLGFSGTSASTPLISGVAALVLSANTNLTYRDVQQVLLLASRHFDLRDADLATNGAGFRVSHNLGFGVPDAGIAVQLARAWSNRPPQETVVLVATNAAAVPDDGLRVVLSGSGIPADLASIRVLPGTGPHPDVATRALPLVDVGLATNALAADLTNKAALIQRGTNGFLEKINYAAQAGADFAIIYNYPTNGSPPGCPGGDQLCLMGSTDFTTIPAVFIGNRDGEALKQLLATNESLRAQLWLQTTNYLFDVTNTLICEQVTVRLKTDHPLRGDLRITLRAPGGTRSILQRYNADTSAGPVDWTYMTTHHFFEPSAGPWDIAVADESPGAIGNVREVTLTLHGVSIVDMDNDGLDDLWEMAYLGTLSSGAVDDPDADGYSNAREQLAAMNPAMRDFPFAIELARWNPQRLRLSWPSAENVVYQVWGGADVTQLALITNLVGRFPEMEWFAPSTNVAGYYQVRGGN